MSSTTHEDSSRGGSALSEGLGPVAEARCWQEPQYEKSPRQMFELVQFDGFRALPPGAHSLYTRAQLDAAVAAERERCASVAEALAANDLLASGWQIAAAIRGA